ncbi:MAG: RNA polymerase sigma factor [Armatimonadetes bacterium]|nr:RNA polymerase sigma factor [Armatimonadota bacterium]
MPGLCQGNACRAWLMGCALHLVGHREDAEDMCQEVCLRCVLSQHGLREASDRRGWLYRILVNVYRGHLRRRKRRPEITEADVEERVLEAAQAMGVLEQEFLAEQHAAVHERVYAALAQLPERHRQLLIWKYIEDLSYEEIARRAGMKQENIDMSLRRAKQSFHKRYAKLLDQEAREVG